MTGSAQLIETRLVTSKGHRGRKIQLSFCIEKACGQHLLESPLAADQTTRDLGDALEITATVVETELLHRWLRGWGDKIRAVKMSEKSAWPRQ